MLGRGVYSVDDVMRLLGGENGLRRAGDEIAQQHSADHLVGDDQRSACTGVGDALECDRDSLVGVRVALTAGECPVVLVCEALLQCTGEPDIRFRVRQTGDVTVVDFGQFVDDHDGKTSSAGAGSCRGECSAEWATRNGIDVQCRDEVGQAFRVLLPRWGQWRIQLTLTASLFVPLGPPMPSQMHDLERHKPIQPSTESVA